MERISSSPLEFKHISEGVVSAKKYIADRKSGKEKSLRTSFNKLNKVFMDGLDWYRIFTIAGLSGSGKSTILENLKRDFIVLNPDENFDILSFEFEMRIEDQLARNVSSKVDMSVKELYSAGGELSDEDFESVSKELDKISDAPIYYVDNVGTVKEIIETILYFANANKLEESNKGLIVTIDHLLLTKGKGTEKEKDKIDNLMQQLVAVKQYFSSRKIKCLFITLSQLNREIETGDRVLNKQLHYPTKNDIFAASSVYYCSDYVLITHKPEGINGISDWYGPARPSFPYGLPVYCPSDITKAMVYWHVIKERFGDNKILSMVEDFKNSKILEYDL